MMKFKKLGLCLFLFIFLYTGLSAMTTQGDRIINSSGQEIELKGVNWFGFNNQQTMVDGLWSGSGPLAGDFATVVYRMKLLGFNAVRLPFSFKDIYNLSPRDFTVSCQIPSQSAIQASVTNPSVSVGSKVIPPMLAPPARVSGKCDDYLPNDSTLNRFLWTINFFAKNGFYVLIDNHLREDQTALEDKSKWIQDWKDLITKISQDPISKKMLMIDILNEPDEYGIKWDATGQTPGLKDLYISAMDAIYPINPDVLFFIEGTGQGDIGANWGDGFSTASTGISNPSSFFNMLFTKPYVNQVVISPHVYPPSVTGATQDYSGSGLYNRLTTSFGYLTQAGYCNGNCKTFPVAIGEMGSRFATSNDIQSMQDFASYLDNTSSGADGKHHAIKNWFYWSWNPNSSDTGGIVDDNWLNVVWKKIDYLATIGLTPWYSSAETPAKTGTVCMTIPPVTGLSKSDLKSISINDKSYAFSDFNLTICNTLPVGNYTITPPKLTTATMEFTASPINISVNDGITTAVSVTYKGTPIVTPVKTSTVCIKVLPVTGLLQGDLKSISINNQLFEFSDFNIAICKNLPVGSYTITPPKLTTATMEFTATPLNVTVSEGVTTQVSVTYKGTLIVTPVKTSTVCIKVLPVTGLSKTDLKSISINNKLYEFTDFNIAICKTLPVGSYTITPPKLTTATMEFTATPLNITVAEGVTTQVSVEYKGTPIVNPIGDITVTVELGQAWQENPASGIYLNSINFYVTNNGTAKISTPWTVTVVNSNYKSVSSFWNVVFNTITNGQIKGTVNESWQTLAPKGVNIVNFGMIVNSTSANFAPTSILINGKPAIVKIK